MKFARSPLSFAVLTALTVTTNANDSQLTLENTAHSTSVALNTITVHAEDKNEVGKTVYSKEELQKTPNSSKNITDFLKVNPNVQFSQDQLAANTQANLNPAEISINGAQSFQNKFIINGVSNSNTLDPVGAGDSQNGLLSGGSQGVALNTDLICKIEVLDSNVSAKYSGFTGGVIRAETCAPKTEIGKIHGSINYDYTSSDWSRYHQETDADKNLFEGESSQANQAEYTKQGISANLYSKLSENFAVDLTGSFRSSILPVKSGFGDEGKVDQKKENTNLGATFFYDPSTNLSAKFGFSFGDLNENNYTESRINSQNLVKNESTLLFAELNQKTEYAHFKHRLNYKKIDNSRDWDMSISKTWLFSEQSKNWQNTAKVFEGSTGSDINLTQETFNYDLDAVFNAFELGMTHHKISSGAGYSRDDVAWQRPTDSTIFVATTHSTNPSLITLKDLDGGACLAHDSLCDESTTAPFIYKNQEYIYKGQYFNSGSLYKAGTYTNSFDQAYLYLEDNIQWKNINARLGLRADYDGSNHNYNFAPRTHISYQPFSSPALMLSSGWNRYYSSPTYMTDLRQAIGSLNYKIKREDQLSEWTETATSNASSVRKNDLKTPYSDEFVFAVNSQLSNINLGLKWVNRQFKDELSRNYTTTPAGGFNYSYEYGNSGYGQSDTYSITLNNINPLRFMKSSHQLGLSINYSDVMRGTPDYSDDFRDADMTKLVSYDGKIMQYADRPASNFNQPITARFSWNMDFDQIPLHISNFFSYKDRYQQVIKASNTDRVYYEGIAVDTYQKEDLKPRFTWDMRATYDFKIAKDYTTILGLTVNNLTDHHNVYVSDSKLYSEIGRQFIADVTFKF